MDNWIGIKEKATGIIRPLLTYQPGQCVTITLIHATKQVEQEPIRIDFFYAPPHSSRTARSYTRLSASGKPRAVPVGSIIVDNDSFSAGTARQGEPLELSLSIDKSYHLHAVLKRAHTPSPVFPFIISRLQIRRNKPTLKSPATRLFTAATKAEAVTKPAPAAGDSMDTEKRPFPWIKLAVFLFFGLGSVLVILFLLAFFFLDLKLPF